MWSTEEVGGIVPLALSFGAAVSQTSFTAFQLMSALRRGIVLDLVHCWPWHTAWQSELWGQIPLAQYGNTVVIALSLGIDAE